MRKRMLRSLATLLLASVFIMLPFASTAQQQGTTRYVYDEKGRIQAVISPTGEATVYEYDQAGNIVSVSRRTMNVTSIVGFNPILGAVGTSVTVFGTGFSANAGENVVTFNGTAAALVTASSTELVVTVPVGASDGPISVTSPSGSATSTASFHVLTPFITGFSPVVGPPETPVTITGRHFENSTSDNAVKFSGISAEVVSAIDTEITTLVPSGGKSGRISVTTPNGTAQTTEDFFVVPSGYTTDAIEVTGRMAFGESKRITLTSPEKVALLIFDGAEGQRMRLRMSQAEIESFDVYISSAEEVLTTFHADSSGGFTDAVALPENSTYTILVVPTNDHTGAVTLSLYDEAGSGTIIPGGPSVQLAVAPPLRDAHLTFEGLAGQRVSLRLDGVTIPSGTVYFYRPGGYVLLSQTLGGGASFIDVLTLPLNGTYTIFIEPQPAANGAATLTLYNVVDVTGSLSLGGPPLEVTTGVPGQNASITFYADAGEAPTLNVSSVTLPGDSIVTVYSSSVQDPLVPPTTVSAGGGSIQLGAITESATYTIFVDPQGPITGGMTLSLNLPLDVTGTLTIDGPPVTVPITLVGQNARLTFAGQAGQYITLDANGVTIPASTVSIIRPDGTMLISPVPVGTAGRNLGNVTLPSSGTYTVFIDPTGGAIGSMTLSLVTATGIIVPGGPPVTVNLTTPAESTSLTFSGTAGQRVSLLLSDISLYSGTVAINKPDGTPLVPVRYIYEGDFIDVQVLPDSGTYTIVVTAPEDAIGNVTLTLYDASEITGTITPGGEQVMVTIPSPARNARLTFSGMAGQRVSLDTSNQTIAILDFSIVAPDGTVLASSFTDGSGPGGEGSFGNRYIDTQVLPVSGVYTVYVDPRYIYTGSVSLLLYDVPADLTGPITPDGPPVSAIITAPGQNARLSFEATTGQRMIIQVDDSTIWFTEVVVYNPDGTPGKRGGFSTGGYNGFIETDYLPADGTYTILIDPSRTYTGTFTLRLISVPEDVIAEISVGGPPVSVTTTAAGQNARLTFDGTSGQKVSLTLNNVTLGAGSYSLLLPSGTPIAGNYLYPTGTFFIDSTTLPTTGRYTILIDGYTTFTGSVTATLTDTSDVLGTIEVNGPPATITVAVPGQRGVLTFNGVAGQWLRMTVVSTTVPKTSQFSPPSNVSMVAPDGTFLGGIGNFNNDADALPLPVDGTYTIIVDPVNNAIGSATISLSEVPPVGSISIDGPTVDVTTRSKRISRLTFDATAGQVVSLTASNFWGTQVSVYGPDLTLLRSGAVGGFTSVPLFMEGVTLPSTGTYHLAITSGGSSDGFAHTLVTLGTITDLTGTITPGAPPTPVTFTTPGQKARLTFDGVVGQKFILDITNVTVPASYVNILKPDDTGLLFFDYFFLSSGVYIETPVLPATGTYTIVLDPEVSYTGSMSVSLVEIPPDVTSAVEVNGASQSLTIIAPGQRALPTFTGATGQVVTITVNVSGATECVEVYLVAPDGSYLNGAYTCSNGVVEIAGTTLPADGVYTLTIDPQGRSTGTFVVTVTSP